MNHHDQIHAVCEAPFTYFQPHALCWALGSGMSVDHASVTYNQALRRVVKHGNID